MNPFFLLSVGTALGVFAISQSFAQAAVFDFYFYLLPFGMALVGLFVSAGLMHFPRSIGAGLARALPLCGAAAILAGVALYVYGGVLGTSRFFLALVVVQLAAYVSLWSAIARGGRPALPATGFVAGAMLGYALIGYRGMDPLAVELGAAVFCAALYLAQFLQRKLQAVAYALIVIFFAVAAFQPGKHVLVPATLGWLLDYGKAGATDTGAWGKRVWGPAGLTQVRTLSPDGRDAWLYTNGAAPSLVPLGDPSGYDDAWWAQKAPLALALFDATLPRSVVDIGAVPSEMAWRAVGRGGRDVYGLYASHDWTRLQVPGLDSIRKGVVPLRQPVRSAREKSGFPVDMIVLSSGHEGKGGWTSSIAGEQTFLDRENILRYWRGLSGDGVLVLFARQQPVFFRQIFSVWAALKSTGMSDAEFLDHAWGIVPDTEATDSPYRYALVLTRKAKDERFARAIRGQVLRLPVKYLFGYAIPPSRPYDYFYRDGFDKVRTLFTQGVSGMLGKKMTLEGPSSHRSVPYQFVEDVYPPYKNFLVLSVGIFIGIVLFPLRTYRRVEYVRTLQAPGVAAWMVAGGAAGSLMAIALAFLLVYPSGIPQAYRLPYLVMLILVATLVCQFKARTAIATWMDRLLGVTSALGLVVFLASRFTQAMGGGAFWETGFAGILFVLLGVSLFAMPPALSRESQAPLQGWWRFAMAAGCAATLFWSMRLYAVLGDGLVAAASLLLILLAAILGWARASRAAGRCDPLAARQAPPGCHEGLVS